MLLRVPGLILGTNVPKAASTWLPVSFGVGEPVQACRCSRLLTVTEFCSLELTLPCLIRKDPEEQSLAAFPVSAERQHLLLRCSV